MTSWSALHWWRCSETQDLRLLEAASPEEAIGENGAAEPPTVLITDIDLGSSLNGFDVAAAAHRLWPAVVLYISGLPFTRKGQELGPRNRYLM